MGVIVSLGECFETKTGNPVEAITGSSQVVCKLPSGGVLSVSRNPSDPTQPVFSDVPAGSTGPKERAWPHGGNPPSFLSYWPDQDEPDGSPLKRKGFMLSLEL